mgnify:CR=1 FL=1
MEIEQVATEIVDSAVKVHRALGPGLLESAYQICLAHELRQRKLRVETELCQPIEYDGLKIEPGYRIDMLVNGLVVVENKYVETLAPIHTAQLLTYLKLRKCKVGFLLNWKVKLMKDGIRRLVHRL